MFFVAFEISVLVFYCLIFYLRYFHFFFLKRKAGKGPVVCITREWRFCGSREVAHNRISSRLISTQCAPLTHETNFLAQRS